MKRRHTVASGRPFAAPPTPGVLERRKEDDSQWRSLDVDKINDLPSLINSTEHIHQFSYHEAMYNDSKSDYLF